MDKILSVIKKIIPKKLFRALQPGYHLFFSWLSALVYGHPSNDLIVIGVTGTTGKTTCVYLIAKMLEGAGFKVGYTSTAMFNNGEREWLNDKKMTMIGRFFTQKIIRQMASNGCQYAIIETTSEGIRQYRHKFINYDILVFTGLYPEHIESHGSFEKYRAAKECLFAHLKMCCPKFTDDNKKVVKPNSELQKTELKRVKKTIIVNADDDNAEFFLKYPAEQKFVVTKNDKLDLKLKNSDNILQYNNIQADQTGIKFKIAKQTLTLNLLGEFNALNASLAFAVGQAEEIENNKLKIGFEKITGVPGRLEKIDLGQNFTVIVDYAFEPKAVKKLYETLSLIPHEKIIHVLGSTGGGRDVARRPKLGELAGEFADFVIVTNEDPYDDDPEIIISQVALGAENKGKRLEVDVFKILDRKEAIKKAVGLAEEGDIVLVTGKGSEQAICVENGKKIPWDDRKVVREVLKSN